MEQQADTMDLTVAGLQGCRIYSIDTALLVVSALILQTVASAHRNGIVQRIVNRQVQ